MSPPDHGDGKPVVIDPKIRLTDTTEKRAAAVHRMRQAIESFGLTMAEFDRTATETARALRAAWPGLMAVTLLGLPPWAVRDLTAESLGKPRPRWRSTLDRIVCRLSGGHLYIP
jgi:hypothetical protein